MNQYGPTCRIDSGAGGGTGLESPRDTAGAAAQRADLVERLGSPPASAITEPRTAAAAIAPSATRRAVRKLVGVSGRAGHTALSDAPPIGQNLRDETRWSAGTAGSRTVGSAG